MDHFNESSVGLYQCSIAATLNHLHKPIALVQGIFLCSIMVTSLCANLVVIVAVYRNLQLQTVTNLLITSMAVADLLVASLIMPFSISSVVLDRFWLFGEGWCRIWKALDVWLCTCSIYNLLAVSCDRFLAIRDPVKYKLISSQRIGRTMITLAWLMSLMISSPMLLPHSFWSDHKSENDSESACQCTQRSNDPAFIVYSSLASFYLPLFVIIILNIFVYLTVRRSMTVNSIKVQSSTGPNNRSRRRQRHRSASELKDAIDMEHSDANQPSTSAAQTGRKCSQTTLRINRPKRTGQENELTTGQQSPRRSIISTSRLNVIEEQTEHSRSRTASATLSIAQQEYVIRILFDNYRTPEEIAHKSSLPTIIHTRKRHSDSSRAGSITARLGHGSSIDTASSHATLATLHQTFRRRISQISTSLDALLSRHRRILAEVRILRKVIIVLVCFVACWFPFFLAFPLDAFGIYSVSRPLMNFVTWLGYANSLLNPFVYTSISPVFRTCIRQLLFGKRSNGAQGYLPPAPSRYDRQSSIDRSFHRVPSMINSKAPVQEFSPSTDPTMAESSSAKKKRRHKSLADSLNSNKDSPQEVDKSPQKRSYEKDNLQKKTSSSLKHRRYGSVGSVPTITVQGCSN